MPLAPRLEPIGGLLRHQSSSPGAGEAESSSSSAAEEEEGEKDGALPQVLPQEDPGSVARNLRARLRV
uniref:Uncharacterized protein n=1 Tax=Arundo donax TaxID=35708 RepID=A0A0A8XPE9_ARUDO